MFASWLLNETYGESKIWNSISDLLLKNASHAAPLDSLLSESVAKYAASASKAPTSSQ